MPYAAGGPVDVPARLVIDRLTAQTKGVFILENRPGAGGSIGLQSVMQSPPDGSTFLFTTSSVTMVPTIYPKLAFDPLRDLTLISLITEIPITVAVRADNPIRDLADLIAHAKANPGKLTFASGGVGTGNHMAGELLKKMAGIDMLHVPFRGTAPAHDVALCGRHRHSFRQHDRSRAARAPGAHPRARCRHAAAGAGTAGFAADRGCGPGLRCDQLVRTVRSARAAARHRRAPAGRTAEGARRSDRQGKKRGHRHDA